MSALEPLDLRGIEKIYLVVYGERALRLGVHIAQDPVDRFDLAVTVLVRHIDHFEDKIGIPHLRQGRFERLD